MRFGFTTYQWGKPWDIPTLIRNCVRAEAFGVELRTSQNYAHGVELDLMAKQRREVRLRFVDSPVMLVGLAWVPSWMITYADGDQTLSVTLPASPLP